MEFGADSRRRGPEVGFEEIALDLLQASFLDKFRFAVTNYRELSNAA